MRRLVIALLATLVVLCGYQWRSIRMMKAEIAALRTDMLAETRKLALQQFNEEHHDEVQRALTWLNELYGAREGLQRPQGLCKDGKLDAAGVTVWLFDTYLRTRVDGESEGRARQKVLDAIRGSGEWHSLHPM